MLALVDLWNEMSRAVDRIVLSSPGHKAKFTASVFRKAAGIEIARQSCAMMEEELPSGVGYGIG